MILLDTHALVWWVSNPAELGRNANRDIKSALRNQDTILISAISIWEIAMLVERERLALTMELGEWVDQVKSIKGVRIVAIDDEIAVHAVGLPGSFHKDPADRFIVATARKFGVPLITKDESISSYEFVKTIW